MIDWLMSFYEEIGKVPIKVGSRYGYAMDPIFEGLFHAAALCVEEGLGTVKEVDSVARKVLKQGVGPFTAMNLTGGNPLTFVGLQHYTEKLYPWFTPTKLMSDLMEKGEAWETAKRGEKVEVADAAAKIRDRMLGAYFGIVGEILDSGISNVADLEMGVQTALVTKPPFEYMNEIGVEESLKLVEAYAADHKGFPVPECIRAQASKGAWEVPFVIRTDHDDIAVLTIRRPAVLNALNKDVFEQLGAHVERIGSEDGVAGAVITGFGRKAFVSGADIGMLAAVKSVRRRRGDQRALAQLPQHHREQHQADRLRLQRSRVRRRQRTRPRLPPARRTHRPQDPRRPAGAQPRHHPRAPAARSACRASSASRRRGPSCARAACSPARTRSSAA